MRPILFVALVALAHACGNKAGTNPFVTGDDMGAAPSTSPDQPN